MKILKLLLIYFCIGATLLNISDSLIRLTGVYSWLGTQAATSNAQIVIGLILIALTAFFAGRDVGRAKIYH